jgi:hypothetical protein
MDGYFPLDNYSTTPASKSAGAFYTLFGMLIIGGMLYMAIEYPSKNQHEVTPPPGNDVGALHTMENHGHALADPLLHIGSAFALTLIACVYLVMRRLQAPPVLSAPNSLAVMNAADINGKRSAVETQNVTRIVGAESMSPA